MYFIVVSKANYLFVNDLFNQLNFKIPSFQNQYGYVMKIDIIKSKNNQIGFSVKFLKNNQTVNFSQIDASNIPFFISAYKEFVSSIEFKQHKHFIKRIKFDLSSIRDILKNREFSVFLFFLNLVYQYYSFPLIKYIVLMDPVENILVKL